MDSPIKYAAIHAVTSLRDTFLTIFVASVAIYFFFNRQTAANSTPTHSLSSDLNDERSKRRERMATIAEERAAAIRKAQQESANINLVGRSKTNELNNDGAPKVKKQQSQPPTPALNTIGSNDAASEPDTTETSSLNADNIQVQSKGNAVNVDLKEEEDDDTKRKEEARERHEKALAKIMATKQKKKHKQNCKRRALTIVENAILKIKITDEDLFKVPPHNEECPICFLLLPSLNEGVTYQECCGKKICNGCTYLLAKSGDKKCSLCRDPLPKIFRGEEQVKSFKKRIEAGDSHAMYELGCCYRDGDYGLPQDHDKAFELLLRAGELGHASAYNNIGKAYFLGEGNVEIDMEKAKHYWGLAAMSGNVNARNNLGISEEKVGNMKRALKHYMIAVKFGSNRSLERIQELYSSKHATKDDCAGALRAYQGYVNSIRSDERDKIAALGNYRYFG